MLRCTQKTLLYVLIFTFCSALPLHGHDQPPPVPTSPPPMMPHQESAADLTEPAAAIEKVSSEIFRIGQVTINKNKRSITFPAHVNLDKGLLEYLLVRNSGKTHESLLRTNAEPYHLQLACLLLGLKGTSRPLAFQGAPDTPTGDPVDITITVMDRGNQVVVKPEQWLSIMKDMRPSPVESLSMIFTGSTIITGRFMAQAEGSIVALYHDPVAIIDNSSPGGEINNYWAVREGIVPAIGTPVSVTIKPVNDMKEH